MDTIEEIKNLKSLLDKREISDEEFQVRKRDILSKVNIVINPIEGKISDHAQTEAPVLEVEKSKENIQQKDIRHKDESKTDLVQESKAKYISPGIIADAGKGIQIAVKFQVISYIFYFLGFCLLLYSFIFEIIGGIMKGYGFGYLIEDNPAFICSNILLALGFIFWIKYLLRLNKAGRLLKKSSEIKYCIKHDWEYTTDSIWGGCIKCLHENDPVKYEKISIKMRLKQI
jgi:hypothetical protein